MGSIDLSVENLNDALLEVRGRDIDDLESI
jgi:hypothetical protein